MGRYLKLSAMAALAAFSNGCENIKPEKPALVLFPSNYAYTHRAMPVVEGTKYAVVTWLGHQMELDGMPDSYRGA